MHIPVLYQEILEMLQPRSGGRYIDGTVGAGGHAAGLLERSAPDGQLLAIDRDPDALIYARDHLKAYADRIIFVRASFGQMAEIAIERGFENVDGILLDLGLSSRQLADADRGFSFLHDGPLDMRFNPRSGITAAYLINEVPENELIRLLRQYGEVKNSRRVVEAIMRARPIETTKQLADVVARSVPHRGRGHTRLHPATQVFQALRIAVNEELDEISKGLEAAVPLLSKGGRMAVISFHSLEDRIVKNFIRDQGRDCVCPPGQPVCTCQTIPSLRPVLKKVLRPTEEEVSTNPRSRSARLRVAQKII